MGKTVMKRRNLREENCSNDLANDHVAEDKSSEIPSSSQTGRMYLLNLAKVVGKVYLFLNVAGCILIYLWPNFMNHIIFQTFIHVPFKNLSNPSEFGLEHTYSFKLLHDDVELGAWHILPDNVELKPTDSLQEHFRLNIPNNDDATSTSPVIILYLHGNTNDRSTGHRIQLYELFRSLGYHIVAVDYRGYGDSTGSPTEVDVVRDALFTYEWIQESVPWASIYVWGHSLGTGITSSMARLLTEKGKPAKGIILEAPFFNIVEEVELHPFTWLFSPNRLLLYVMEQALTYIELQFRSDIHLTKVSSKIMILHAEDDFVIPVYQADKLYKVVSSKGISQNLTYHRFSFFDWCGHRHIYTAPNITQIIRDFIY